MQASGHTLVNAFNKIDKQDVSTVSLSTALLDMFRQSYERPKTVPRLSDENKKVSGHPSRHMATLTRLTLQLILRSVRKRFLRDNVDQNLLQVIKIERRARDVAAAAARVQELVVGLARDGGFGLADRIEQDTVRGGVGCGSRVKLTLDANTDQGPDATVPRRLLYTPSVREQAYDMTDLILSIQSDRI